MTNLIPKNLRVNADDFGLSPSISRAILKACEAGWVNSISTVPFSDAESTGLFERVAQIQGIRIGAHLTFLEVPLLTKTRAFPAGIPPADYRKFLQAWITGKIQSAEVYAEWQAQLNLLQKRLGGRQGISHLDSHQHVHLLPVPWGVTQKLRREFSIPRLRVPWEGSWRAWRKDFPFGAALQTLAALRRPGAEEKFFGVGASMGFQALAHQSFVNRVANAPEQTFELMIHPDEDARGQKEMDALRLWLEWLRKKSA